MSLSVCLSVITINHGLEEVGKPLVGGIGSLVL